MPSRLRPAHLATMRKTQESHMPDLATVRRPAKTKNAAGGTTDTPTTISTGLPCRAALNTGRAAEGVTGGQIQTALPWIVRFQWDANNIRLDDTLDVTLSTGQLIKLHVTGVEPGLTAVAVYAVEVR